MPIRLDHLAANEFEQLAASYFRSSPERPHVRVAGQGPDGGADIIVTYEVTLAFGVTQSYKILVQCKHYNRNLRVADINTLNIPSLLHSKNADAYILMVSRNFTEPLQTLFNNLEGSCTFKRKYRLISGNEFIDLLLTKPDLIEQYNLER